MSNIKRQAVKDANEFAMAKMFYGEGAGVRRRLITSSVEFKKANIPGYAAYFEKQLSTEDFAKLSRKARRERRVKDATQVVSREGKAFARRALLGETVTVVAVAYWAHQNGLDKVALNATKTQYSKAKAWVHKKWYGDEPHQPTDFPSAGQTTYSAEQVPPKPDHPSWRHPHKAK